MPIPCVCVRRTNEHWGVTQKGLERFLEKFTLWQDAVDCACGLAAENKHSLLEREDFRRRIVLRRIFSTDAAGGVCVRSLM